MGFCKYSAQINEWAISTAFIFAIISIGVTMFVCHVSIKSTDQFWDHIRTDFYLVNRLLIIREFLVQIAHWLPITQSVYDLRSRTVSDITVNIEDPDPIAQVDLPLM